MEKRLCDQDGLSNQRCWADLPIDQIIEVADHLSYVDFLRFGVVCKQWRASLEDGNNKIQSRRAMFLLRIAKPPTQYYMNDRPELKTSYYVGFLDLLSKFESLKQRLGFYNSLWEERRQYKHPPTRYSSSYSDWLLFLIKSDTSGSDRKFYLLDPFGKETKHVNLLPPVECYCGHWKVELASFSTNPTYPGSVIFFLWKSTVPRSGYDEEEWEGEDYYFTITIYDLGYRRWGLYQLPCENPDDYQFKDVVYADGTFYCAIDMNSKVVLGSFNVALQEWVIMNSSTSTSTLRLPSRPAHLYLANDSDRKVLLAVFYYNDLQRRVLVTSSNKRGRELFCHVYQFDLSQEIWIRVTNLGNRVLLLSSTSSIAVSAESMVASEFANTVVRYSSCGFVLEKYTCNTEGEWGYTEKG